jgi:putative ABC transport system permease protein
MSRPLRNVGLRHLFRHPWQTVLMILGITLGVAVVVAIDLANAAAAQAFDLSTDAIAGRATHQVIGGPAGLDEAVYARLRTEGGGVLAAPVLADYIESPQLGRRPLQMLGVDPFAEPPFRSYLSEEGGEGSAPVASLRDFLARPGALLLSESLAAEYGLGVGDALTIKTGGQARAGYVAGLLRPSDGLTRRALDGLLLADLATAQELTGRIGRLDRIDLILSQNDPGQLERIAALLPPGVRIVTAQERTGALEQMTAAFRTNLTALSLLALVVGMFLIYNSMTFSVVQRRPLFGTLRCLGVTRGEVARMVLIEAAIVGAVGSLLGLALGVVLGQGAVRLVTQTINDLYYVVNVRGAALAWTSLAKGLLLGVGATVAAAALPAWEAASVPPRQALSRSGLEDRARRAIPLAAGAGIAGAALGGLLLALPGRSLHLSFAGIFCITIGLALMAPIATMVLLGLFAPVTGGLLGVLGRMAPRGVTAALSRTVVAIAALSLAVSVTIGVGLMVDSFRGTVVAWLEQTLWGDVYISAPGLTETRSAIPLDPRVPEIARQQPGVVRVDVLRSVDVNGPEGPVAVAAVSDEDFTRPRIFVSTNGPREAVKQVLAQGAVLASEPLANRLGLPPTGATVTLYTDHGAHAFPVAGIYRDYSSSQGAVMMSLDLYRRYWDDPVVTAAALTLAPGTDVDRVVRDLQDTLAGVQGVLVRPNEALRVEALAVFDRAFAITGALQLLAAVVAFIGILSALLALQLERGREFGVLRAVGLTRPQMRWLMLLETGLMGTVAGLLALPTGIVLAVILVYIINRRSFGWTLALQAEPAVFVQALLLAVGAAVLAGIYPAIRLSRMETADALRSE